MADKTAIVTGITGQDGSYAAELLLRRGYRVVGTTRNAAQASAALPGVIAAEIVEWNLVDDGRLRDLLSDVRPTEFYNFSAYSTGSGMFDNPVGIGDINGLTVVRILDAIRSIDPTIRFCQASSSEMFGDVSASPQNEATPFHPRSPYGAAKLYAHSMIDVYRRHYGIFACSAILFNHESPRRSLAFVTRKISHAAASIKLGLAVELRLGNLDAKRDWGFAADYGEAMWLMLQSKVPGDYVVATGRTYSVRDLCEQAFRHIGLDYRDYVRDDPSAYRSGEGFQLVGDPSKARRELGWSTHVDFPELVRMMVDADLARLRTQCEV